MIGRTHDPCLPPRMTTSTGYTLETRVGRLIEARVTRLRTRDDANRYSEALGAEVARLPRQRAAILCADHRPIVVYPQPVTDRLVELFQVMNTRLERIAIFVSPTNATLLMQLERLVREAAFSKRRVFREPSAGLVHLGESLDPAELARARAFLDEYRPA